MKHMKYIFSGGILGGMLTAHSGVLFYVGVAIILTLAAIGGIIESRYNK